MRAQRPRWRAARILLASLATLLSIASCEADAPEAPSNATVAAPTPIMAEGSVGASSRDNEPAAARNDQSTTRLQPTSGKAAADATLPTATPTSPPMPRASDEERPHVHRATVCVQGRNAPRPGWLGGDFVQWTPDGSTILFTDGPQIYAAAADGSRLWQVVEPHRAPDPVYGVSLGFIAPFTLSPDGDGLYYATCRYPDPHLAALREAAGERLEAEDYRHELAWVRVDGTQHHRLTMNSDFETDPVWSPDGARVAFIFREYDDRYGFFFSRKPFGLYADGAGWLGHGATPERACGPVRVAAGGRRTARASCTADLKVEVSGWVSTHLLSTGGSHKGSRPPSATAHGHRMDKGWRSSSSTATRWRSTPSPRVGRTPSG